MNYIQLFISDYDRTLTNVKLKIGDKAIEALAKLKKNNMKVAIVSGRKYSYMKSFYDQYSKVIDAFIAENGCIGFSNGRKEIISHNRNRGEILEALSSKAISFDAGEVVISVNSKYEKVLHELLASVEDSRVIKNIDSLMILPRGASKGIGVKWISNKLNIPFSQTACIGDGENDIEMRNYCSILGAVANAVPELKKVADYICQKGYSEGVLEFVEKIILKLKSNNCLHFS
jgi:phosphoglycolate phosphatase (TIGR01487 family)